ncbi:MAG: hypothetical protein IJS96_03345 [Schwartzia sp.]|nr:hypothetical protein [Schwartzia sp. (in: firmicutes)]
MELKDLKKGMKLTLDDGRRVEVLGVDKTGQREDRTRLNLKGTVYLKDLNEGYLVVCHWTGLKEKIVGVGELGAQQPVTWL